MRLAAIGTVLFGLLLAVDSAYLCSSRGLKAHEMYLDNMKAALANPSETEKKRKHEDEASAQVHLISRVIDTWQGTSFVSLAFLGCGLVWLTMVIAIPTAATSGTVPSRILKGSVF